MTLKEFRDQYPGIKPYTLMRDGSFIYEVISWPWEEDGGIFVNVRTTRGDPTTLKTIQISIKESQKLAIKNIFLIAKEERIHYALVPENKLNFDHHEFNGCTISDGKSPCEIRDGIITVFQRLGIIPINIGEAITTDLKEYLNPIPPFQVDDICSISL